MTSSPLHNRLFRQLIAIEDSGSIRKAAERLNLSQPALSKGIQEFERRLAMSLLHRGRSVADLTAPASAIVKRSRQILLRTEAIEHDLTQCPQPKPGHIHTAPGLSTPMPLRRAVL